LAFLAVFLEKLQKSKFLNRAEITHQKLEEKKRFQNGGKLPEFLVRNIRLLVS
jgi:hypothetical protein